MRKMNKISKRMEKNKNRSSCVTILPAKSTAPASLQCKSGGQVTQGITPPMSVGQNPNRGTPDQRQGHYKKKFLKPIPQPGRMVRGKTMCDSAFFFHMQTCLGINRETRIFVFIYR